MVTSVVPPNLGASFVQGGSFFFMPASFRFLWKTSIYENNFGTTGIKLVVWTVFTAFSFFNCCYFVYILFNISWKCQTIVIQQIKLVNKSQRLEQWRITFVFFKALFRKKHRNISVLKYSKKKWQYMMAGLLSILHHNMLHDEFAHL